MICQDSHQTHQTGSKQPLAARLILQAAGLRFTRQRIAILGSLAETFDYPTAETVLERSRRSEPSLSLATVYRNLSVLQKAGIVCRYDLEGKPALFALRSNAPQGFIIEISNSQIIAIHSPELEAHLQRIAQHNGFELIDFRLELHCTRSD